MAGGNRTTVKSNIVTLDVPSVTNAVMNNMLNDELADSVVFREDVAVIQNSSTTNISVNFTDKDRIELTRTGGSLNITVSGLDDGDCKWLLITKTSGQSITFVSVTDVTPSVAFIDALSSVLYEIIRKGSLYYARAIAETPLQATDTIAGIAETATQAECNALTDTTKIVTPARIPEMSQTQNGIARWSYGVYTDNGNDTDIPGNPLVIKPSELVRYVDDRLDIESWIALTVSPFTGNAYYYKDQFDIVHLRFTAVTYGFLISGGYAPMATLPAGFRPSGNLIYSAIWSSAFVSTSRVIASLLIETDGSINVQGVPTNIPANYLLYFELSFRSA